MEIDDNDLIIGEVRYEGTPGLYELIFKAHPSGYIKRDKEQYRDILTRTKVHHLDYDASKRVKVNKGYKHTNIIKPLIAAPVLTPMRRPRAATVSRIGGRGGQPPLRGKQMLVSRTPYQYVYWDDINELVVRLKLLIASQQAGHTGHRNEIASIIEELKEAKIIR